MIKHKTLNIKFIFKNVKHVKNISSYQTNFYSKIYIYIYYVLKIILKNICKLIFSFFNKKVGI